MPRVESEAKLNVNNRIYVPAAILRLMEINEGSELELKATKNRLVVTPKKKAQ
jgi:AbrB family looped-hinge helix DNA binding protein